MAEYQKVEYRIGKAGKITEEVINASSSCIEATLGVENIAAIAVVGHRRCWLMC